MAGNFVNPGNEAFYTAVRSKIYVDKTGLIAYTNSVLNSKEASYAKPISASGSDYLTGISVSLRHRYRSP